MITILDVTIWSDKENKKLLYKIQNKQVRKDVLTKYKRYLEKRHEGCDVIINVTENPNGINSETVWKNKVESINAKLNEEIQALKDKLI